MRLYCISSEILKAQDFLKRHGLSLFRQRMNYVEETIVAPYSVSKKEKHTNYSMICLFFNKNHS